MMLRLPINPLRILIETRQLRPYDFGQALDREYHRSLRRGWIYDTQADRICIKHLDIQPELLWPDEWRQDEEC
jgi:hypothetical protein